jgi:hypothetical protein
VNGVLHARPIPDTTWALKLKMFIGQGRANGFGPEHPLGQGFRLLREFMTRGTLLTAEWPILAVLNLRAQVILTSPIGDDRRLKGDLCNTERCRALLFEADVAEFVLRKSVQEIGWRRYAHGVSDFLTVDPQLQVECKLVTKNASVERVMEKAFERVDQLREGDGPFVLVAGCDVPIEGADIKAIPELIGATAEGWFDRHREVAAVIAILPEQITPVPHWDPYAGYQSVQLANGSAAIVRSNVATTPLPPRFDFKIRDS